MGESDQHVQLNTTGMHCRSCSMLIDMTLNDLEGVQSAETDLEQGVTDVSYDPARVSVENLIEAIRSVGYDAELRV